MRVFILLINFVLTFQVAIAQSKYFTDKESKFAIREVTSDYCYEHVKERGQEPVIENIQKKNGVINLALANGKISTFKDSGDTSSDTYEINQYLGTLKAANLYILATQGYETFAHFLIEKSTGETKSICGYTIIEAFNGTRIACTCEPADPYEVKEEKEPGEVTLELIKVVNKTIVEDELVTLYYQHVENYSFRPDDFNISWETPDIILLELTFKTDRKIGQSDYKEKKFTDYLRISRKK